VKIQATFAESKGQLALSGRSSRARTRTKNIMQEAHLAGSKQKRKIVEGQLSLDDLDQKIDDGVDIISKLSKRLIRYFFLARICFFVLPLTTTMIV
jgi:hypothetical protein